ncbi:hypothetical protein GYMLUDRAFT_237828 [Collybiopsis luxurians FD-317 M1]|nr:hypothetical protein GYMLUDRAFT_237828 [Collybiopsis luxurians FD-317 M1]
MAGKYFGSITTSGFLYYYLPTNKDMHNMPEFCTTNSAAVAGKRSETEMYNVMISALRPFFHDIVLLNTSTHNDPDSGVSLDQCIKPDISFYNKSYMLASGDRPTNAKIIHSYRQRYSRADYSIQHIHLRISVPHTRLLSLCELVDVWAQDSSLATFSGVCLIPALRRGIDTTFHRLTEEKSGITNARQTLQLVNDTLYKASVVNEEFSQPSFHIVSDPLTSSHRNKVVLLKDNWRIDGFDQEGKTYQVLNSKNVRNIPKLITAGNVSESPAWTCGNEPFSQRQKRRVHFHYRLVLETVGYSLITHFTSIWQLINAIYDATICEPF